MKLVFYMIIPIILIGCSKPRPPIDVMSIQTIRPGTIEPAKNGDVGVFYQNAGCWALLPFNGGYIRTQPWSQRKDGSCNDEDAPVIRMTFKGKEIK